MPQAARQGTEAGRRQDQRRRCGKPLHDAVDPAHLPEDQEGAPARRAELPAGHERRANGLPALIRDVGHLAAPDLDRARLHVRGARPAAARGRRHDRLRHVRVARRRDRGEITPAVGSRTGKPVAQGTNDVQFSLFLPTRTPPADGWPVAILGHGFTDWKNGAPPVLAGAFARSGIATVAINVVGHGGGALGTYTVNRAAAPSVTLALGGRGIDQDGNTSIDATEGVNATPPYTLIGTRDGLRQTTIDLMQLVKVLKGGVDVDADGADDLSDSRIYYAGQSFGGIYGTQLLGLERDIRAGVLNVPGGSIIEIARLSPSFRPLVGIGLISRTPSLYNAIPNPTLTNFHENIPLRGLAPVVASPDEASIQELIDRTEWAQQSGNPAAYARHVRAPVIYQFARGDQTVPNPTTAAILRACDCADRATLYRHDLAFAAFGPNIGRNPHAFLTNVSNPLAAPFAVAAHRQMTTFLTSGGATTIDPDGPGLFFETPTSIVPEDLAFIA